MNNNQCLLFAVIQSGDSVYHGYWQDPACDNSMIYSLISGRATTSCLVICVGLHSRGITKMEQQLYAEEMGGEGTMSCDGSCNNWSDLHYGSAQYPAETLASIYLTMPCSSDRNPLSV